MEDLVNNLDLNQYKKKYFEFKMFLLLFLNFDSCLTLNIFLPAKAEKKGKDTVMNQNG
jgi:hypothetical protein